MLRIVYVHKFLDSTGRATRGDSGRSMFLVKRIPSQIRGDSGRLMLVKRIPSQIRGDSGRLMLVKRIPSQIRGDQGHAARGHSLCRSHRSRPHQRPRRLPGAPSPLFEATMHRLRHRNGTETAHRRHRNGTQTTQRRHVNSTETAARAQGRGSATSIPALNTRTNCNGLIGTPRVGSPCRPHRRRPRR